MSPTCISLKRLRNARLSAFLPAYAPGGFCVAKSMKCGCGRTVSDSSGTNSSRLSSSRRFSASRTSVGARFSSSSTIQWPCRNQRRVVITTPSLGATPGTKGNRVGCANPRLYLAHGLHEGTLHEHQAAVLSAAGAVGDVTPQVLLQVGVLVVVQPHKAVAGAQRQVLHQRRLARTRRPLQQHRVAAEQHGARKAAE
eukprot:1195120-Prorocentrum_minimum.AAC.1